MDFFFKSQWQKNKTGTKCFGVATSVTAVRLASASRSYYLLQSVISDLGGFAYFFFLPELYGYLPSAKQSPTLGSETV